MNLEEAKGAYGLIISVAQIGAILGSTMATQATKVGIPLLFLSWKYDHFLHIPANEGLRYRIA